MKNLKFLLLTLLSFVIFSCSTDEVAKNSSSTNYKISVTAGITTNNCNTVSSPYHVSTYFLSDDNIVETNPYTGINPTQINSSKILTGDIIGIKLKLTDFNSSNQNSGKGIAVQYMTIVITNADTGQLLLNKTNTETFQLYICTDTIYEGTLLYNTSTNTFIITKGIWNF